jgi:hypothetical protein
MKSMKAANENINETQWRISGVMKIMWRNISSTNNVNVKAIMWQVESGNGELK